MSQIPNQSGEQEPIIPPHYLLILSGLGFLAAFIVRMTQANFGVVGYGGLAFGVLALLMWVLLAPDQARGILSGRTARFGGTSLLVTLILLVALIGIYAVISNANLRVDLTERDTFSLTDESRQAIAALGAEPGTPNVRLIAFYGATLLGARDQDALLFDEYAETSGGKVSYEYVDPEKAPQVAQLYGVTFPGQIAVVPLDEVGEPVVDSAELISSISQQVLTNAILKVSSSGVFNAYFLIVDDSASAQMSLLKQTFTDAADWNVQDISVLQLTSPQSEIDLDDPNVTGQVIVIPGGSTPLPDDALQVLIDYVAKGGDLIVFAGSNLNSDMQSLATADNLSNYLMENFGLRFNNDIVLDNVQAFQSPLNPGATDLDRTSPITTDGIVVGQAALVFRLPSTITIADTPPENVTVTALARSADTSYAKTDLQAVLNNALEQTEADPVGPFVLAASAENTATGAHVVLFGSPAIATDEMAQYSGAGIDNFLVAFNSFVWTTNFNDYFSEISIPQQVNPQDTPIFVEQQELRNISFITSFLLPFGVLVIGGLVWWNNRERAR